MEVYGKTITGLGPYSHALSTLMTDIPPMIDLAKNHSEGESQPTLWWRKEMWGVRAGGCGSSSGASNNASELTPQ